VFCRSLAFRNAKQEIAESQAHRTTLLQGFSKSVDLTSERSARLLGTT